MLHKISQKSAVYWAALALVVLLGAFLRVSIPDTGRSIIPGDETTYHYAALDILKYGTLTREITGDMYSGRKPVVATSWLSPGYPIYLAAVYKLFGVSTHAVLMSQVGMSILMLLLFYKLLGLVEVNRTGALVAMALFAVYPGLIYNIDRMLTEQLFVLLFTLYVYLFLSGWKHSRMALIVASGVVLACAGQVRAQAMPFAILSVVWLAVYGKGDARKRGLLIVGFVLAVLAIFIPWWIRNYVDFGRFILLTEAGDGPRIWGSVPYFIDMGSNTQGLATVVAHNMTPNPSVYYKWRIFGFLQYMWGDVWDEHLVHPNAFLRSMLLLQPLVVVPTLIAIPIIAFRRSATVLFIAAIPLAFTLMNFPFHGLPRYVYPGIPFVFILTGLAITYLSRQKQAEAADRLSINLPDRFMRHGFTALATVLSLLTAYSVYVFSQRENLEMSAYRLSRYMGVGLADVHASKLVQQQIIHGFDITAENTSRLGSVFFNDIDGPAIVNLDVAPVSTHGARIVTEVTLRMSGGYLYDYSTIYWTGTHTPAISENDVYKFPNSFFAKSRSVYIDDDVTHLMFVPYVFHGGSFVINAIEIRKYLIGSSD